MSIVKDYIVYSKAYLQITSKTLQWDLQLVILFHSISFILFLAQLLLFNSFDITFVDLFKKFMLMFPKWKMFVLNISHHQFDHLYIIYLKIGVEFQNLMIKKIGKVEWFKLYAFKID